MFSLRLRASAVQSYTLALSRFPAIRHIAQGKRVRQNRLGALKARGIEEDAPHYFIELEAGGVLHLYGEYLFDYEPLDDEPEFSQPRQFPCSVFTLKRGVRDGYVVFIQVGGGVLEPEAMPVSSPESLDSTDAWPDDGAIIRDASYQTLKRRFLGAP